MTPRRPLPRRAHALALAAGTAIVLPAIAAACGDDAPTTAERYCASVQANLAVLESPAIQTDLDITATLDLYRSIADEAPIAVEPEWQQLVQSLETAATVNPADPASVQLAADTARITEPAAVRVQQYTQQICGVAIGDPPPVTDVVTATTLPPDGTDGEGTLADDGA